MLLKPRKKSAELLTLQYLSTRMNLQSKDKQHYLSLKKGYEGEKKFDIWTSKLQCDCIILNDLLLQMNHTTFQIDSLIITADRIYLYEVKNFEGDYIYDPKENKFFIKPNQEIINPLHQLERCESLLNQLLLKYGFHFPMSGAVVFIHDEFTLYQAPTDKPFIFLSQLRKYFTQLNATSTLLSKHHVSLGENLKSLHTTDDRYKQIPPYKYEQLRKGITCRKCSSFSVKIKRLHSICEACGCEETISDAVMRTVKEFQLLFPEKKITARIIQDWCRSVKSRKTITAILARNFRTAGENRWIYYE
jgi:hypothetical protein